MLTNLISAVQNVLNKEASAKLSCGYNTSATIGILQKHGHPQWAQGAAGFKPNSNLAYPCNKVSGHFMALWRNRLIHILHTMNTHKRFQDTNTASETKPTQIQCPVQDSAPKDGHWTHELKLNANLDLIVAMTTVKDFITAGGSDATPPSVVWTPAKCHDHLSEIFQLGVSGSLTL